MTPGQQLASSLRGEVAAVEAVLRVLEEERVALTERDPQRIEHCAAAKDAALRQLAALQQARKGLDTPGAVGTDRLGDLVASLDNREENEQLQAQLLHLGERCETLNSANGVLIERLQQHTRNTLRVLRGDGDAPDLYSGSGATTQHKDRHSLGHA